MDSKMVKIVIGVVCLIAAAVIFAKFGFGGGSGGRGAGAERPLMCAECKHAYVMALGEYDKLVAEKQAIRSSPTTPPIDCPKCGKETVYRALKCKKCDTIFMRGDAEDIAVPDKCPKCGYSEVKEKFGKK